MPLHPFHGTEPRGLMAVLRSPLFEGRFGRMFRNLPPFLPSNEALDALARQMVEPEPQPGQDDTTGDNPDIPAGFTYVGQFVDHDLTFDPTSQLQRDNDRTPWSTSARPGSTSIRSTVAGPTTSPSSTKTTASIS